MADTNAALSPGPGVDARGLPVRDPTINVDALVKAGLDSEKALRIHGLKSLRREQKLHNKYRAKLAQAESARLDAIHAADEAAKAREAIVNAAASTQLAKQVTDTATTLQASVEAQRQSTASELRTALVPIQTSIAELTKNLYAGQGEKVATVDSAALAREAAATALAAQGNSRQGIQVWIAAAGLVIVVLAAIFSYLAAHFH